MKIMPCDCKDWKLSMPKIEAAQMLASIHNDPYTGEVFRYCPWCGKKRVITYRGLPTTELREGRPPAFQGSEEGD